MDLLETLTRILFFRANDIDKATNAKYKVEQKQRDEAKTRKDENAVFDNKVRLNKCQGG
jgi:hypothetical protein